MRPYGEPILIVSPFNPDIHHRHSMRLIDYDYSQEGLYFVTICTRDNRCLFGQIKGDEMCLNGAGQHANQCWYAIPQHFPQIKLHAHIVMPNHVHGVLETAGAHHVPKLESVGLQSNNDSTLRTLGSVIRGFKIGVTKWFREQRPELFPIGQSIWQRNYYEHIIRDEKSYLHIAEYITNNPLKWGDDTYYVESNPNPSP